MLNNHKDMMTLQLYLLIVSGIFSVDGYSKKPLVTNLQQNDQDSCKPKPKTTEGRLIRSLLCNYDQSVRPVMHQSNTTLIKMAAYPKSLSWISEERNRIWLTVEIYLQWKDELLSWHAGDFGLDIIYMESSKIWTPDIFVSDPHQKSIDLSQMKCELHADGQLDCTVVENVAVRCNFDLTYFPYDSHPCAVVFSQRSYKDSPLDLDFLNTDTDLLKYVTNHGIFNIKSLKTSRNVTDLNSLHVQSVDIEYSFIIERKGSTYKVTYTTPALVMIMMALSVFWLEVQSSARIILPALSIISHLIVIQCLMQVITSVFDSLPVIIVFFRDSLFLTGLTLVWAVAVRSLCTSAYSPFWIYKLSTNLNNNAFVKMILPQDLLIKPVSLGEEDESSLVVHRDCIEQQWRILTLIMDRILFVIYILCYIYLYIKLTP